MNTEGPYIEHNEYLCGSNHLVETLSLYSLSSLDDGSLEEATSPVFSLDVLSQIVFNFRGTLQLSMASMYGLPKFTPNPTHTALVVTPPTLWCCNSHQDPCLTLNYLTLYPPYINTVVLSLLITPPHTCLTNLVLPDTKKQVS